MTLRVLARHRGEHMVKANVICESCQGDLATAMHRMYRKIEGKRSRRALEAELPKAFDACRHVKADDFRPTLFEELDKVVSFDSFL
jgi:hypothetical protein